ncbi:hypothetical protein BDV95DRAFT_173243 [Massariosphaeria phaeospora]|uniref:Uncharacterized protein n=1 Tax=Massariosphaeria phaeospora TaxID=100035 RepID=A0A7C8M234_9PLEO|nr:hypothetical protein BDV95DRAFT_173243 [Massariosphaeria phaeospora]
MLVIIALLPLYLALSVRSSITLWLEECRWLADEEISMFARLFKGNRASGDDDPWNARMATATEDEMMGGGTRDTGRNEEMEVVSGRKHPSWTGCSTAPRPRFHLVAAFSINYILRTT